MTSVELKIANRTAYFRKAITKPNFASESVLTRDAFEFVELWLTRNCNAALPYWRQSKAYFDASRHLPVVSAPLTSYYCFLNATKALLIVKEVAFTDNHGVTGRRAPNAKRIISNEEIEIKGGGVLAGLSSYLGENSPYQRLHRCRRTGQPSLHTSSIPTHLSLETRTIRSASQSAVPKTPHGAVRLVFRQKSEASFPIQEF